MQQMKFNGMQFFALLHLFLLGSASFLDPATDAGRDAWLALLISIVFALLLFKIYMGIYKANTSLSFIQCLQKAWGKYIGGVASLLYIVYCIYLASRVLRDFSELLISVVYEDTTFFTVSILMVIVMTYAVTKKFTALARASLICFTIFSFIAVLLILAEFISGTFSIDHLKPLLENGWKPVFKAVFPTVIEIPFGESVVFLMLLHYITEPKKAAKIGSWSLIYSGIWLSFLSFLHIGNLGVNIVSHTRFPLLTSVGLIRIGEFFTRVESMAVFILILIGFVKICILFFCAVSGTIDLFHLSDTKMITFLIGILILVFATLITAGSYLEHIYVGFRIVPKYVHLPMQIFIPLLLLCTIRLRSVT